MKNAEKSKFRTSVTRIIGILGFTMGIASAETIQKHPRVAELEDDLRDKAGSYLKARFPEQPFLVNVSVEPLRRINAKTQDNETLPFFDSFSEEIKDEWDVPTLSLQHLQLRTTKIVVDISLSSGTSDSEIVEVRENIFKSLHLTPARDEVKIEVRNWTQSSNRYLQGLMALGLAVLFLIGLYLINRQSTQKITRALAEGSKNTASSVSTPMGLSPAGMTSPSRQDESGGDDFSGPKRGLELSDPIKISEIISKMVNQLRDQKDFPNLQSMIILDDYGRRNPGKLGAILSELPVQMRNTLFSMSAGDWWFDALLKAERFELSHLEIFQKLIKESDTGRSPALETMLIHVWRLNEKLPVFIRSLDRDRGMAILGHLPKGKAIEAGRKAFPGAWADLLDPDFKPRSLSDAECKKISDEALKSLPLRAPQAFEKHKIEMELREFLSNASVEEEREIYLASKSDSAIHLHRPPFFKVLDAEETALKLFVPKFTPDQWAQALFNVAQTERKKIQKFFSEKQNYMFIENLKRIDRNPESSMTGRVRELIGFEFRKFDTERETSTVEVLDDFLKSNRNPKESDSSETLEPQANEKTKKAA
ncbi:MAG: hypothetical protein KGP28_03395 [Bdellovibrionales bacterium]|nr:hypothetical protein [Bdellovibrionales bacterium]